MLFPILSFKNSRAEFNFGSPKRPCKWMLNQGFKTLDHIVQQESKMNDDNIEIEDMSHNVDWNDYRVIDELWVWIFECLEVTEIFSAQFICKKWYVLLNKYNIMESIKYAVITPKLN